MNVHEEVRGLLALSAAGLLEPEQERMVRQHADTCITCRAELQEFGQLAGALGTLPAPAPPMDLAARTQARVMADRERREAYVLSIAAALCAGILAAAAWFGLEPYFGEWVWVAGTGVPSLLGAGAALMLASRRWERSSL